MFYFIIFHNSSKSICNFRVFPINLNFLVKSKKAVTLAAILDDVKDITGNIYVNL